eukprot:gnl/Spiro4/16369_TR8788_c0_g1_i1.p1 gnl/Spiro4/16369_TR8788_c0_g1~~gnl/Spiro4/16369_TR8788_c0_g1_i1.p1  ORF type:complete len:496 (+),score=94.62 gnl/Spiro4/16369_TR8788_c0_g1_i1:32-1489(+)
MSRLLNLLTTRDDVEEYVCKHRLRRLLQGLFAEMITKLPSNPLLFLMNAVKAKSGRELFEGHARSRRATVLRNGTSKGGQVVLISGDTDKFLADVRALFGLPIKRIFSQTGAEFTDVTMIDHDETVFVSCGEDFKDVFAKVETTSFEQQVTEQDITPPSPPPVAKGASIKHMNRSESQPRQPSAIQRLGSSQLLSLQRVGTPLGSVVVPLMPPPDQSSSDIVAGVAHTRDVLNCNVEDSESVVVGSIAITRVLEIAQAPPTDSVQSPREAPSSAEPSPRGTGHAFIRRGSRVHITLIVGDLVLKTPPTYRPSEPATLLSIAVLAPEAMAGLAPIAAQTRAASSLQWGFGNQELSFTFNSIGDAEAGLFEPGGSVQLRLSALLAPPSSSLSASSSLSKISPSTNNNNNNNNNTSNANTPLSEQQRSSSVQKLVHDSAAGSAAVLPPSVSSAGERERGVAQQPHHQSDSLRKLTSPETVERAVEHSA